MDDPIGSHPTRGEQLDILASIVAENAAPEDRILDFGCGTGNGTLLASKILDKSVQLTASDWSDKAVQIVKKISEHENREIFAKKLFAKK